MSLKKIVKEKLSKMFKEESVSEVLEALEETGIFEKKEVSQEEIENSIIKVLDEKFEEKFEKYTTDNNIDDFSLSKMLKGESLEDVEKIKEKNNRVKAYRKYMIQGGKKLTDEEEKLLKTAPITHTKAMNSVDFAVGGVFAHEDMIAEILKDYVEYSPVRQLFGVKSTTEKTVTYTRRPDSGKIRAYFAGELETLNENEELKYKKGEIPLHKLTAIVNVTREDLMYSTAVDLEKEVNMECTEQLAVAEADAVINGDGVDRAEGILVNAEIEKVTTAATTLAYKDINKIYSKLKPIYRRNAIWIMNRAAIELLMGLEDGAGRPIFFTGGQFPSMQETMVADGVRGQITGYLLGKPVYDFPDMPDDVTTSGTALMALGDFKKGYKIGDRTEMFFLRDEYSKSFQSVIKFQYEKYCGGKTILPEAIKILKLK